LYKPPTTEVNGGLAKVGNGLSCSYISRQIYCSTERHLAAIIFSSSAF